MILPCLYFAMTDKMGKGIFTSEDIAKKIIVEISPVIVMNRANRILLDQTRLHDYIFEWGDSSDECCMALGFVPLYNHSYKSNCEYDMDYEKETITIKTMRFIKAGEELFVNYNGDWNNKRPVWFHK